MFLYIAVAIVVLVVAVLAYAATRPGRIHVHRGTNIKAPAEQIFPLINDFHRWVSWSPYETRDPAMKKTYSGAASGRGAVYEWNGNKQAGQGRMEIIEVSEPAQITIKLDFLKPFEGHNVAEFALHPQADSTRVTWSMDGPSSYMTKLIGVFFNMDKMIGKDFETGLANLKTLTEKSG